MEYAKDRGFSLSNAQREAIAEEIMGYGIEPGQLTTFIQSVTHPGFLTKDQRIPMYPAALVEWLDLMMPDLDESLAHEAVAAASLDPAAPGAVCFGETINRKAQDSVLCFLHEQLTSGLAGVHAIMAAPNDYYAQSVATVIAMEHGGLGYFSGKNKWVFEWVQWHLCRGWAAFQKEEAANKKNPPARGGNAGDGNGPELTPRP